MPREHADRPVASVVIGVCIVEAVVERNTEIGAECAVAAMTIAMSVSIAVVMSMSAGDNRTGAKVWPCRKWCAAQAATVEAANRTDAVKAASETATVEAANRTDAVEAAKATTRERGIGTECQRAGERNDSDCLFQH